MNHKVKFSALALSLALFVGMSAPPQAGAYHGWHGGWSEHGWHGGWGGGWHRGWAGNWGGGWCRGRHLGWYRPYGYGYSYYGNPYYSNPYSGYYGGTWMDRLFGGGYYNTPRYYRYSRSWW